MTLDDLEGSLYTLSFKTRASWCCYLFISSFTFSLLLVDKWLPECPCRCLTFRKLKQITINESWDVGRTRCIARFPCDRTVLALTATPSEFRMDVFEDATAEAKDKARSFRMYYVHCTGAFYSVKAATH